MAMQPNYEGLAQMRIAHLEMIQGVIARMSGFSATVKNLCVTILAALTAVAFQSPDPQLAWLGALVPLMFALLDAYYLSLERRYRTLYADVITREMGQAHTMDLVPPPMQLWPFLNAFFSWSVFFPYVSLGAAMVALISLAARPG